MSSEVAQHERAFQRQATVSYNPKKGGDAVNSKRYVRPVGLGFKTPRHAKDGNFVDKKCPFTGNVRIRWVIVKCIYKHFTTAVGQYYRNVE